MNRTAFGKKHLAAVAIYIAAAALALFLAASGTKLVLADAETGAVYARYPLRERERFSVEFIHSVNQSPVRDSYERRGRDIYVVETDYFAFGAGVQTELNPGETLSYGEDGSMRVQNINIRLPQLTYVVGTVSDHTLRIGGETVSLRELCGRNSAVTFSIERNPFSFR